MPALRNQRWIWSPLGLGFTAGIAAPGILSYGVALLPGLGAWAVAAALLPRIEHPTGARAAVACGGGLVGLLLVLSVVEIVPR